MDTMFFLNKSIIIASLCICLIGSVRGHEIISAFQISNVPEQPVIKEGSDEINLAKDKIKDAGSMVYFYIKNTGSDKVGLRNISWDGKDIALWEKDYQAIWMAARPLEITANAVGEVALCLRTSLTQKTVFELELSDRTRLKIEVSPQLPEFRIMTIAIAPDYSRAFIYIVAQHEDAPLSEKIFIDGKPPAAATFNVNWLSSTYISKTRVAEIVFSHSLQRGKRYFFTVSDRENKSNVSASLRAFGDLSVFGTYGGMDLTRYADNSLNGYSSFCPINREILETASTLQLKVVNGSCAANPDKQIIGHPGLYAHLLQDEPDCVDYSLSDRPMGQRIGGNAPEMLRRYCSTEKADSNTPALLTIDLTFTPYNYFIYGPLADITNPDIYTNTCGWSVKSIDDQLKMVKRSTAPRPFTFSYQSGWEENSSNKTSYVSAAKIYQDGWDKYRDKSKTRGFGFATNPDEITIAMFYGIGNGATGLFAFWDCTESSGGLLFHGTRDLPENWAAVGRNSQIFKNVSGLLNYSHPVDFSRCDNKKIWIKTLLCGTGGVLIATVNENYECDKAPGLKITPESGCFTMPDLPWLTAGTVYLVTPEGFEKKVAKRVHNALSWQSKIRNASLFLIAANDTAFQKIDVTAKAQRQAQQQGITQLKEKCLQQAITYASIRQYGEMVEGRAINGYRSLSKEISNIKHETYNVFEFWEESGNSEMGAEWEFSITSQEIGQAVTLLWEGYCYGAESTIILTDPNNKAIQQDKAVLKANSPRIFIFKPLQSGKYVFRVVNRPDNPGEHGGQLFKYLYVYSLDKNAVQK